MTGLFTKRDGNKTLSSDGVLIREVIDDHDGVRHGRLHQPNRAEILEQNKKMQNDLVLQNMDWAGWELCIPEVDMYYLKKKYPDLNSPDAMTKTLAWKKFMGTSECDIYRVRPKTRIVV